MALKDVVVFSNNSFKKLLGEAQSHGDNDRIIRLLETLVFLTDPEQGKAEQAAGKPAGPQMVAPAREPAPAPHDPPQPEEPPACPHRFGFTNGNCNRCGLQMFPDETPHPAPAPETHEGQS